MLTIIKAPNITLHFGHFHLVTHLGTVLHIDRDQHLTNKIYDKHNFVFSIFNLCFMCIASLWCFHFTSYKIFQGLAGLTSYSGVATFDIKVEAGL